MGYQSVPTYALNQAFLDRMIFLNRWKKSPFFQKLLEKINKTTLAGNDMETKVFGHNGGYFENATAGAAVGNGAPTTLTNYALQKKTKAMPIDMDLRMLYDLSGPNPDKAALNLKTWFDSMLARADDLIEFEWMNDGSGAVAAIDTTGAISSGVVTLAAGTPKKIYDKILTKGTFVCIGTISSGVVTVTKSTGSGTYYLMGYVIGSTPPTTPGGTGTVTISATLGGSVDTNMTQATVTSMYMWLATPATQSSSTACSNINAGLGLNQAYGTADNYLTMPCMSGLRKLNEYHSSSTYGLYGVSGAGDPVFNPVHVTGSSTTGLTPQTLQLAVLDQNTDSMSDIVFVTSGFVWADWCNDYRQNSSVKAELEMANYDPAFVVDGKKCPIEVTTYWNGAGELHGLDVNTFRLVYTPSQLLHGAGLDIPGFDFRLADMMQPSVDYYGYRNQLVFTGNLVSTGLRNRNLVITGLQTSPLSK